MYEFENRITCMRNPWEVFALSKILSFEIFYNGKPCSFVLIDGK